MVKVVCLLDNLPDRLTLSVPHLTPLHLIGSKSFYSPVSSQKSDARRKCRKAIVLLKPRSAFLFDSALLTGCNVQILFVLLYGKHYSFCSFGEDLQVLNFSYCY